MAKGLGRIISSNGYAMIRNKKHLSATSKGYVYEHRLIAEQKLGRPLFPGEVVHHLDGNKLNNNMDNIKIVKSLAHHRLFHRKNDKCLRRLPEEKNVLMFCKCGCGKNFLRYDDSGRPRSYITGHNGGIYKPTMDKILNELQKGIKSVDELNELIPTCSRGSIRCALSKLTKAKLIVRIKIGLYGPIGSKPRVNYLVKCLCGCGKKFYKYDKHWRERKYINGHYTRIQWEKQK